MLRLLNIPLALELVQDMNIHTCQLQSFLQTLVHFLDPLNHPMHMHLLKNIHSYPLHILLSQDMLIFLTYQVQHKLLHCCHLLKPHQDSHMKVSFHHSLHHQTLDMYMNHHRMLHQKQHHSYMLTHLYNLEEVAEVFLDTNNHINVRLSYLQDNQH